MKIALVHDWLTGRRGGEKCLEMLCQHFPNAQLFTLLHRPGAAGSIIERMPTSTSFLQQFPGVARYYRCLLPLMPTAIERIKLPADIDLVVSLSHAVAKSIRPPPDTPHLCYCFTPMRYAWHMRDQYFAKTGRANQPSWGRRAVDLPLSKARNWLLDRIRDWDRATSDRVTRFVAISHTVRRRIRDCYQRDSQVVYPPVDTDFFTPAPVDREDFYLCVSALVPYKRIELAIDACNQLGRRLYVIGEGPRRRQLEKLAGPTVKLLGWKSDTTVRDYLRRCRALLFPGCEDFGIVPVEAQACGTPVIALAEGGASETVIAANRQTEGTGVFFTESLVAAIRWLEANPQRICEIKARRNSLEFSRHRFERELLQCIEEIGKQDSPLPTKMQAAA